MEFEPGERRSTGEIVPSDIRESLLSVGQNLSERIAAIDPHMVAKLAFGSREQGPAALDEAVGVAPRDDGFMDSFRDRFSKAGDGFADVWAQSPRPT